MTINLLEGDNCKWMDKMIEQGIKVDLVVTSPPYDNIRNYNGEGNLWDFEVFKQVANRLYKLINDGCVVVWVVADQTVKGGRTLTSFKQALYFLRTALHSHLKEHQRDMAIYMSTCLFLLKGK